ncbi:MAG: TolC family protein, partial [Muribaculaceae bacterium]|nr:TolC family protein [Muribaculaceae bacterium]
KNIFNIDNYRRYIYVAFSLVSALPSLPAAASINPDSEIAVSKPINIPEALDIISRNNPSLQIAAADNEAEEASIKATNIPGKTSIEYSPFFLDGEQGVASSELIVRQSFEFPTLYTSRNRAFQARRSVLEENLSIETRQLRLEAAKACIEYIGLRKQNDLLTRRISLTDSIATLYERKLRGGSATLLECNRIALTMQDLKSELLQNNITISEVESGIILLNGGKPIDLSTLDYGPELFPFSLSDTTAHAIAYQLHSGIGKGTDDKYYILSRPEVKAADAEIELSDREITIARSGWLPEISLGYRRNTDGKQALNGFLVGLDFSLFSSGKESKVARARKAAAKMRRESEVSRIESERSSTLSRLELIYQAIKATDTTLIEETLALYSKSLELGQITLTEYYQETDILFDRLSQRESLITNYYNLASSLSL